MGIFYIKIQQILLIWFSEPDTEPKIAAEPGSAEPVSRYVLTLPPRYDAPQHLVNLMLPSGLVASSRGAESLRGGGERAAPVLVGVDGGRVEDADEDLPLLRLHGLADAAVVLQHEEVLAHEGALQLLLQGEIDYVLLLSFSIINQVKDLVVSDSALRG